MRSVFSIFPLLCASLAFGQPDSGIRGEGGVGRYAIVLTGEPVAVAHPGRVNMASSAAQATRTRLAAAQKSLASQITQLGGRTISVEQDLVNAIFILATPDAANSMRFQTCARRY